MSNFFLEIGFRIANLFIPFMERYDLSGVIHLYSAHPYLNHTITPNLDCIRAEHLQVNIGRYHLKTNALGFRFDPLKFRNKGNDIFRIAVLGDSLIEGYQEEYTLPNLLVKELTSIFKTDKKIEAMSFGVMSYSPLIHYVNLKRNILKYDPDLIILHFDMTDVFDDNNRYKDLTVWDEEGNPQGINPSIAYNINIDGKVVSIFELGKNLTALRPLFSPYRTRIWLIEHSYLFRFIYFKTHSPDEILNVYFKELENIYPKISTTQKRVHSNILEWCTNYSHPVVKKQIEFSFSILNRIHSLLMRNHIPLLIITFPNRAHLKGVNKRAIWSRYPLERIEAFCRHKGIPFHVPIYELEEELNNGKVLYFSDNMHPNYMGQKLWAKSLASYMAESPLKYLLNRDSPD